MGRAYIPKIFGNRVLSAGGTSHISQGSAAKPAPNSLMQPLCGGALHCPKNTYIQHLTTRCRIVSCEGWEGVVIRARLLAVVALVPLLAPLPARADLVGTIDLLGTGELQVMGTIGIGTIKLLPALNPLTLTGDFAGLGTVLTWQNVGQTISLAGLGTNSDLACGSDCLFTLGAAEFHVNTRAIGGDINQTFTMEGIGTLIVPGLGFATDQYLFVAQNPSFGVLEAQVRFSFSHAVPGPIAGAGLPGLIFAFGGLLTWYKRRQLAQIAT